MIYPGPFPRSGEVKLSLTEQPGHAPAPQPD